MTHLLEDKQKTLASLCVAVLGIAMIWFTVPKIVTAIVAYQQRVSKMTVSVNIPFEQRKGIEKDILDIQNAIRSSDKKGNTNYSAQYLELGLKFEQLGYLGKAETAYQKGLKEDPKSIPALIRLGVVLSFMDEYDKSITSFREAIELNPTNSETYTKFADMYQLKMKKLEEARGVYIEGLMRTQNDPTLVRSFVSFLESTGYGREAELYKKALARKDDKKLESKKGTTLNLQAQ